MPNKKSEIKVEVVKVATIQDLTIKLLTTPVGEGIRLNNQEIVEKLLETFGKGSINCVRWYSSKLRKDRKYQLKYGIEEANLFLTPRVKQS